MCTIGGMDLEATAWARRAGKSGAARHIRESSGITLRELARHLEVAPSTISRWERGCAVPKPEQATAWALALRGLAA
jgi:transcriptional regulator with XRE-family HTH domain